MDTFWIFTIRKEFEILLLDENFVVICTSCFGRGCS